MDATNSDSIIPLGALDRMVGTYVGGSNTGVYYEDAYGTQAEPPQQVIPTESITITPATAPTVAVPSNTGTPVISQQKDDTSAPLQTNESTTGSVDISAPAVATTIVNGIFSFAVTASIICGIFVLYIIIRTRQLHHHEEHVRGVLGHGHGDDTHTDAHAHGSHDVHHDTHVAEAHVPHTPMANALREEDMHDVGQEKQRDIVIADGSELEESKNYSRQDMQSEDPLQVRHQAIQLYVASDDEHEWRYALMDMDLLLDDVLLKNGYSGADTVEKLSHVDIGRLHSIASAREAHSEYQKMILAEALTKNSIQHLYQLYAPVFTELGI